MTGRSVPVLHRTYVAASSENGAVWLVLCLYSPFVECRLPSCVIDNRTGLTVPDHEITHLEKTLLSDREKEILSLLARGLSSKQIAAQLFISINTVYRHRQNIIGTLHAANTTEAVSTALAMGLI